MSSHETDLIAEKEAAAHLEAASVKSQDLEKNFTHEPLPQPLVDPYDELSNSESNKKLLRKQDIRIIPLLATAYLLAYLDRSNIGNAKVMSSSNRQDLLSVTHTTNYQYSIALMVFSVAYTVFEVPANYFLKRVGPSRWIALLMVCWGTISMSVGAIQSFAGLTVTRFLLGAFEAGLVPGIAYYCSLWYRANERSTRLAFVYSTATLSGAFGGALAYGVSHLHDAGHLQSWRWLFIIEGAPSITFGIVTFFCLPDYPETARWLTEDEHVLAKVRMTYNDSHGEAGNMTWQDAKKTLCDWRLYLHYLSYFCKSCPFQSLSLFAPSIVKGLGYSDLEAQLMVVPPYAAAFIATLVLSYLADKFNRRSHITVGLMLFGAAGFIASACLPAHAYGARYACLIIATVGTFATIPILIGWLSTNLHSTSAQGLASAINISFGAPGQIVGVWIYKANEEKRGYPTGHWTNGALMLVAASLTTGLTTLYTVRNRRLDRGLSSGPRWAL